ncbi:MAG: NADH-quinone oxidoreductase subunit N [Anaerolineales bacterium]|jgi:NADH-quinone oxidoreductase subunit N
MTFQDLLPLLPLLVLSASIVIVMLVTAFKRDHRLTFVLSLLGLAFSLVSLPFASRGLPRSITPLIVVDSFAIFYLALVLATGLVVVILSFNYIEKIRGNKEEYYLLLLLGTLGAAVLVISNHFVSFFLGLETLSISLYTLIAYTRFEHKRVEAAIKYLVLAAAASSFLLFGMALAYLVFGTMQFDLMDASGLSRVDSGILTVGLAMLMVGIGFKLALVPFHMWAPDVYQGAPAPVTAFVATVSKGGIFALLLRLFANLPLTTGSDLWNVIALIAILSMLSGNILAVVQNNVKRLLAYSSIAHFGYLMVAFLASNQLSNSSMTFYLVVYIITSLMAFGVIAVMSDPENELENLDDYRGLFRRQPRPAIYMTLALLSLASLPPTGGLIGKIFLAAAGVESSLWLLLAALVIGSIVGIFYYLRVVITIFRQPEEDTGWRMQPLGLVADATLVVLSIALLALGIVPNALINLIENIVSSLG